MDFCVVNGFVGMRRDVVLKIVMILGFQIEKIKAIIGMCCETFEWKMHFFFQKIRRHFLHSNNNEYKLYYPMYSHFENGCKAQTRTGENCRVYIFSLQSEKRKILSFLELSAFKTNCPHYITCLDHFPQRAFHVFVFEDWSFSLQELIDKKKEDGKIFENEELFSIAVQISFGLLTLHSCERGCLDSKNIFFVNDKRPDINKQIWKIHGNNLDNSFSDKQQDMWSLGMILFELYYGKKPNLEEHQIGDEFVRCVPRILTDWTDLRFSSILQDMLRYNGNERIDADGAYHELYQLSDNLYTSEIDLSFLDFQKVQEKWKSVTDESTFLFMKRITEIYPKISVKNAIALLEASRNENNPFEAALFFLQISIEVRGNV